VPRQGPLEPPERLAVAELCTQAADRSAEQSFAGLEVAALQVSLDAQAAQRAARKKQQWELRDAAELVLVRAVEQLLHALPAGAQLVARQAE
jgi:hypothetical protein